MSHILSIDRNKSPLQISGKVAGGVCEDSKLFRAPIYWAHRTVVFAIARLSCLVTDHPLSCLSQNVCTNTTLEFCIFTEDEYLTELVHAFGISAVAEVFYAGPFLEISEDFFAIFHCHLAEEYHISENT